VSRQTNAKVRRHDGSELVVQDSHSDSPLLPIAAIEQLHQFRPDRVDWVFNQTQIEAEARRNETRRTNTFIFIERLLGLAGALIIGIIGVAGGAYVGLYGNPWLGGIIATSTISTLAVAFIRRGSPKQ
jgi:hypothetical protein